MYIHGDTKIEEQKGIEKMSKVEAIKSQRAEEKEATNFSAFSYNPKDYLKKLFDNGGTVFTVPQAGGGYMAAGKSNSVFS